MDSNHRTISNVAVMMEQLLCTQIWYILLRCVATFKHAYGGKRHQINHFLPCTVNSLRHTFMHVQDENTELQGLISSLEAQLKLAQAHLADEQVRPASHVCFQELPFQTHAVNWNLALCSLLST